MISIISTLSERLARSWGIRSCNLETRSVIWASVIWVETGVCLERDLLVDIVNERVGVSEIGDARYIDKECLRSEKWKVVLTKLNY